MKRHPFSRCGAALIAGVWFGVGGVAPPVSAQNPPFAAVDREKMWFAPTAADWSKPCLIQWQRTWDDAVAVAHETGKPLLICVNMDGEIASEHYAGVRYRQPEIAKLYEPYVCVIASVYRHSPRDYDEAGQRILCPRFGGVTCGEHIAIEPPIFEKFLDGQRVAPRHIVVDFAGPDDSKGREVSDVFYAWDTDSVFASIKKGVEGRPPAKPIVRGDRPLLERVKSRDNEDRVAVEKAYAEGDAKQKRALLDATKECGNAPPIDLLRLALRGFDPDAAGVARKALAKSTAAEAAPLIADALRGPVGKDEQEALGDALGVIGETSPRARTMAATYRGLTGVKPALDREAWLAALAAVTDESEVARSAAIDATLAQQNELAKSADPKELLRLAEAFLARALAAERGGEEARLLALDAEQAASVPAELLSTEWRPNAVLAVTAFLAGNRDMARKRAEAAISGLNPAPLGPPANVAAEETMIVLALFAEARWKQIADAAVAHQPWSPRLIADVSAAYAILERHPFGMEGHFAGHCDVLEWLGALGPARQVLNAGIARFPDSELLHQRLRQRLLADEGVAGLEREYAALLTAANGAAPTQPERSERISALDWFSGHAAIVAAEFARREARWDDALAAYHRARLHYEVATSDAHDTNFMLALIRAGVGRIAFERGQDADAVAELVASLSGCPDAAATEDGLGLSPVMTARALLARLRSDGKTDLAERIDSALSRVPPELQALPAYEQSVPPLPAGRGAPDDRR